MIDIHSHIIPMVDDGSKNFYTTEKMFKTAFENGFSEIFATPHFIDKKSVSKEVMFEYFEKLSKISNSFGIKLYLGNEVFICPNILELYKEGKISSLNNSRYLLIELPRNSDVNYFDDVVFQLESAGIVPIIAHPERYGFIIENPERVFKVAEHEVLFQLNSGSLIGDYGERVKKTARTLLKYNTYQFMGTDAHSYDRYEVYNLAKNIVLKVSNEEALYNLTEGNPAKVRDNLDISCDIIQKKKSVLFWR